MTVYAIVIEPPPTAFREVSLYIGQERDRYNRVYHEVIPEFENVRLVDPYGEIDDIDSAMIKHDHPNAYDHRSSRIIFNERWQTSRSKNTIRREHKFSAAGYAKVLNYTHTYYSMSLLDRAIVIHREVGLSGLSKRGVGFLLSRMTSTDALPPWLKYMVGGEYRYSELIEQGALERSHYGYCIYQSVLLAKALGHSEVSVLELGVGGGEGLRIVEDHCDRIEEEIDISIEAYGFDSGSGLPEPEDYRDIPYFWQGGDFRMDSDEVEASLSRADLVLGDVAETVDTFQREYDPAPIGCLLVDLDYYSSTRDALEILCCGDEGKLPRVVCYFDAIYNDCQAAITDFVGERRAIDEFNDIHDRQKIGKLRLSRDLHETGAIRPRHLYSYHDFDHPEYDTPIMDRCPDLFIDV